jgi:hypothetical protein
VKVVAMSSACFDKRWPEERKAECWPAVPRDVTITESVKMSLERGQDGQDE